MAPCTELKGIYRIIGIIVFVCDFINVTTEYFIGKIGNI